MIEVKLCTNKQTKEQKFVIAFNNITHNKDEINYHNFIELKEKKLIVIFVSTSDGEEIKDKENGNSFILESYALNLKYENTEEIEVIIYNDNELFKIDNTEKINQPRQTTNGGVLGFTEC